MLNSEVLHSLKTSVMQAVRNAADGLNSASAVLGAAKSAKQIARTMPLRMVVMAYSLCLMAHLALCACYALFERWTL